MNPGALATRIGNLLGPSATGGAESVPSRTPPPVPDHEILARIGGGSYGEIWLARSVTGALRAVKVVWRRHFSSDRPYEREFHGIIQFEPISRSHPGVVNVLHVGRDDAAGCFFYVMELADNANTQSSLSNAEEKATGSTTPSALFTPDSYRPRTLASELKARGRLPVIEAVSLGVHLAGSLGHLHRHGLVHRDVKPSNVIFVNGQAKLADIGLVTGVHEERSFVGTEGFIPPEGPGSERADLFALGRLLYEAATGMNCCDFPGLPADLDRWPKTEREALIELNEVLTRVCAAEPKKRHSNAAELAGDLNIILAGRSVRRAYRTERQLRRATWISIAALLLVFVAVFSNWFQRRQRESSEAQARLEGVLRKRAEAAERESQWQLYNALLEQARATVLTGELGQRVRALDAVRRASAISNSAELRGVAIAALALPDLRFDRELPVAPEIETAILDPSFERLAVANPRGPIEIRSVSNHQLLATLPPSTNRPVFTGIWAPDGRHFAVTRDHQSEGRVPVEVWDVVNAKRLLLLRASAGGAFAFHPNLPQILIGQRPSAIAIWDLETGAEVMRQEVENIPNLLKFAPDGLAIAVSEGLARSRTVTIYARNGAEPVTCKFLNRVHEFEWHPAGRWLAVGDNRGGVHLMDPRTGQEQLLGRHKSDTTVLRFHPDGRYLFSGGWDRELICWDLKSMRRSFTVTLDAHRIQVRADGRQCAIMRIEPGMRPARVELHAFEPPELHREFSEDMGGPRGFASFSADGKWLAASGDERLVVWDLKTDRPGASMKAVSETRVYFAPNGELFVNPRNGSSRWRVIPGADASAPPQLEQLTLSKPAGLFSFCLLSNSVLFTGTQGSRLTPNDQPANTEGHWTPTASGLNGVSPDERWMAIFRPFSPHLYIHRLPSLERVAKLTNTVRISQFEFSPRSDELAVASRTGIQFWSTTNWQRTRHLPQFREIIHSSDGKSLWLTSDYRNAGLYDALIVEPLLPLPPNTRPLAISADGHYLAVNFNGRYVQVWDLIEVRQRLRDLGLDWAGKP